LRQNRISTIQHTIAGDCNGRWPGTAHRQLCITRDKL
jgi:hypothetical protein